MNSNSSSITQVGLANTLVSIFKILQDPKAEIHSSLAAEHILTLSTTVAKNKGIDPEICLQVELTRFFDELLCNYNESLTLEQKNYILNQINSTVFQSDFTSQNYN